MKKYSLHGFRPAPITEKEAVATRCHQGIPGIERLDSGRLFATWYGGELKGEGPGNYVVLATSSDNGFHWREIQVAIPPSDRERAYDPTLWLDPDGRLWWSWSQCVTSGLWDVFDGRSGVWAAVCDDPDTDTPVWSAPRRIADGVMMNKPTVLSDASWAFPTALWKLYPEKLDPEYLPIARSNLSITRDRGRTFELVIGPDVPDRCFDEHMLIEQRNGTWRVLVRTHYGIGQAFSDDRGQTWAARIPGSPSAASSPAISCSSTIKFRSHCPGNNVPNGAAAKSSRRGSPTMTAQAGTAGSCSTNAPASPTPISPRAATDFSTASTTATAADAAKSCSQGSPNRMSKRENSSRPAASCAASSALSP